MLDPLIDQLKKPSALTEEQVRGAVEQLVDESVSAETKAAFLTALALKGETIGELAAFASALREKSIQPPLDKATRQGEILDVCGTGGDHLQTFNISTAVALVAAGAGVVVAKHGNRAITSQSGSADVLEALGIRIDLPPEEAARWLRQYGFAFFFAQKYHPAFKHIGPARKLCALQGQRTIFNFLGPLLNPAWPTAQLIGVPLPSLCEPMARVLQSLGVRRGMVVSGYVPVEGRSDPAFLDEFSTLGETTVAEFHQDRGFHRSEMSPEDFPVRSATLEDLTGGDREENATLIRHILAGLNKGPKRDAVLLNAAAALFLAGRVKSMNEGWEVAGQTIDQGRAEQKLEELIEASRP